MKCVFTFTIFGSSDKYCKGLLRNIELIHEQFPDFFIYIYIGNDVPDYLIEQLKNEKNVKLIFTDETGMVNKLYRFFAIDDNDVDIMFVRDADSRVLERDASTIHDFLQSDKLFHIVRDHPNHFHRIMACSLAIKKPLLNQPIRSIFNEYRKHYEVNTFWNDQDFLAAVFYPHVLPVAMIHDDLQTFEPYNMKTTFKVPIKDGLDFVGQVYLFDENGQEYPVYKDFLEGGVHGKDFWTRERLERIGLEKSIEEKIQLFIQIYRLQIKEDDTKERKQKIENRNTELQTSFIINTEQDFIETIYIFYEKEEDKEYYESLANEKQNKLVFIKYPKQPHYKDFLVYIKNNIPHNKICCILASDVYLNYDINLSFFKEFLDDRTVFGITRHEPTNKEHTICNMHTCAMVHSPGGCADCFFFRTPLLDNFPLEQVDHKQNRWGGECNLLNAFHKAGYTIKNPCYQVKTIHMHDQCFYPTKIDPQKVSYGRPYLPDLEAPPKDSNHCINRPSFLCKDGEIVCFRCFAYPNILTSWHNSGRDWTCGICHMYNTFENRKAALYNASIDSNIKND